MDEMNLTIRAKNNKKESQNRRQSNEADVSNCCWVFRQTIQSTLRSEQVVILQRILVK